MRVRLFGVVVVAVTVAALLAAHGFASSTAPGLDVPVKITDKSCTLGYTVVSRQYTRIVFGVFNNGSVAHGFDISGSTSPVDQAARGTDARDQPAPR